MVGWGGGVGWAGGLVGGSVGRRANGCAPYWSLGYSHVITLPLHHLPFHPTFSEDLETVIPRVGSSVRILNGRCRGARAELTSINVEKFNVSVRVTEGPRRGVVLEGVEYEDISKLLE